MRLNIGGGFTYCDGFTNVDICKEYSLWWFPFKKLLYRISGTRKHHTYKAFCKVLRSKPIRHDVRKPLPFEDDSVDEIYTSHLLEHLTYADGLRFLEELRRVIKPDGIIRIVSPEYDKATRDILFNEYSDEWSRHKYVWRAREVVSLFPYGGFCEVFDGYSTAISLDSMPEQSFYVEVWK
jgi:SAM-dependent methyltransferase